MAEAMRPVVRGQAMGAEDGKPRSRISVGEAPLRTLWTAFCTDGRLARVKRYPAHLSRRFGLALLLFLGLSMQAQLARACEPMGGITTAVCCCGADMDMPCPAGLSCQSGRDAGGSCCKSTVESAHQAVSNLAQDQHAKLLKAPQPPPALLVAGAALLSPPAGFVFTGAHADAPPRPPGPPPYLATLRLRI